MIIALLCTKMDLYDSVVTTLATAGTGGFAVLNNSIAGYNNLASEIVITIFTALFGINFTVFFMLLTRQFRKALFNSEVVFYLSTIGISTILIAFNIYSMYQSIGQALRHASFNVVTIITTTGFSSTDFDTWPQFSKVILVLLMVLGACAGSTGGGLKCSRVLILCKAVLREIRRMITPRRISILKMDGKPIPETTITNTSVFAALYFAIAIGAMLIVAIDNFDFTTTIVSVISCIGNVGPALGPVAGPTGNYNSFSDLSKIVLSLCMLVGRLEIFPMIVLFYPKAWKGTLAKK